MNDTQSGEFNKKEYRVAGNNAAWKLNDGVLTIPEKPTKKEPTQENISNYIRQRKMQRRIKRR